jgi:hypothetical protein
MHALSKLNISLWVDTLEANAEEKLKFGTSCRWDLIVSQNKNNRLPSLQGSSVQEEI